MKNYLHTLIGGLIVLTACTGHTASNGTTQDSLTQDTLVQDTLTAAHATTLPEEYVGVWGTPHFAVQNLTINADGTFLFNDYDDASNAIIRKGTVELADGTVILHYTDGGTLTLFLTHDSGTYYLATKDKSYYLVKGLAPAGE